MKMKMIRSIAITLAFSVTAVFAAETVQETPTAVTAVSSEEIEMQSEDPTILERLEALEKQFEKKAAKTDWTEKVKLKADLRYRYEYIDIDGSQARNRQRIRVRIGAYADVNDATKLGIRIRTGNEANSGNETIGDSWNGKDTFFDLAYMTIAPEDGRYGALTFGKMKYPWKVITDMLWDSDINPEGIAYTYDTKLENTGVFASTGYMKVEEDSSSNDDLDLIAFQAGIVQPLNDNTKMTLGGSFFYFNDDYGPSTFPVEYQVAEAFTDLSIKELLPFPIKFFGSYANNIEESSDDEGFLGGIKFADAKKGKWQITVDYRDVDEFTTPNFVVDSDFAGGGTNVKGGRMKAKYNIFKNLQAGVSYIVGEQKSTGTDVDTLHLDLIAKF
jgi:hypothetical protein